MSFLDQTFSLQDKIALVTGAGRGLGRAIAEGLLRAGATVILAGPPDQQALQQAGADFRADGLSAVDTVCDLACRDQIDAL